MNYPRFYHYNRFSSDKDFVMLRMNVMPENMKAEVSKNYEKLYLDSTEENERIRRKNANTYLHNLAKKYRG